MLTKDYVDKKGIRRRVLIPDEGTPPDQGIPISIRLDEELQNRGMSQDFIKRLYDELWARNLVSPSDFLRTDSPMLVRSALLSSYLVDGQIIQSIAKEQSTNGKPDTKR